MQKSKALLLIIGMALMMSGCQSRGVEDAIDIVSREQGSGTRSAFEELVEINTSEDSMMTLNAGIKDGNGLVATYVARNMAAIGYVSFVTLEENNGQIIGLKIDGVAPTATNVLSGSYTMARPFNMVFKEEHLTDVERAFIRFLTSEQGLLALQAADAIVDLTNALPFDATNYEGLAGNMTLGGSTSTEHAVMAAAREFTALLPRISFTYEATGSGAGIRNAEDGTYSLGFASREIKASELENGLQKLMICQDGIVLIVHPENNVRNISLDQLRRIYKGEITFWNEIE